MAVRRMPRPPAKERFLHDQAGYFRDDVKDLKSKLASRV
jgi:hypothetical protein